MQTLVARAQSAFEEQLLPLLDHAVAEVVENDNLEGQIVGRNGFELAEVHANAGIAVDIDDQALALRKLRANGGRQAEAHRAHASRGEPKSRTAKIEILRGPHLMLPNTGRDDRFAARQAVDFLDHRIR